MKLEKKNNETIKKPKKDKLQEKIDKFQQNIEELKNKYPDTDFSQIEELLSRLEQGGSTGTSYSSARYILGKLGTTLFNLFIYCILICMLFGFFAKFINFANPFQFLYIIPSLAFLIYVAPLFINGIGYITKNETLSFILSISFVFLLAWIDQLFFHIFYKMLDAVVILFITVFILEGVKFLTLHKFYKL